MTISAQRVCKLSLATVILVAVGCERQLPPDRSPNMARAMKIRQVLSSASRRSSSSSAQTKAQPKGWATLRGVFKMDGPKPEPVALVVDKDTSVCAPGGRQIFSQALEVGDNGGIKNMLIYLDMKPRDFPDTEPWTHPSAKPGKTDEVEFDQKECIFLSRVLAMQATQRLKILNSDPVGHNTNMTPVNNPSFNQTVPVAGHAFYQPNEEERSPFSVTCSIHPWMQAWIITRRNSYFAVTQDDGSFEIANLPAGVDLEFRVWQEKSSFVKQASATLGGKPQPVSRGRLTLNLVPNDDSQNQLEVVINSSIFQ